MRTVEECYEYVLTRCGELADARRKKRSIALKTAVPVCGVAAVTGIFAAAAGHYPFLSDRSEYVESGDSQLAPGWLTDWLGESSAPEKPTENPPKYENELNIGSVDIDGNMTANLYAIPGIYEMTRDEVLEHFGLSTSLDLSCVIPELYETAPKNGILNIGGKHGFCRFYTVDENGSGTWEELSLAFDNEEFCFESADGEKIATVFFDHADRVDWLRSGLWGEAAEKFYSASTSTIAGVQMRIAKRSYDGNYGGYYAEFNTETLSVGLSTSGLSESETVAILEYLAEYVGAANPQAENSTSVGDVDIPVEGIYFN